jgi:hypothetical protein
MQIQKGMRMVNELCKGHGEHSKKFSSAAAHNPWGELAFGKLPLASLG